MSWLSKQSGSDEYSQNLSNFDNKPAEVAWIDESRCIGCIKCIQACPVGAIVGARKLLHTVVADECIGCRLCTDPCPTDCIEMHPLAEGEWVEMQREADSIRRLHNTAERKQLHLVKTGRARPVVEAETSEQKTQAQPQDRKQQVSDAIARMRARKMAQQQSKPGGPRDE